MTRQRRLKREQQRESETLDELIDQSVKVARELLRAAGLPDSPVVHWPSGAAQPQPGAGDLPPDDAPVGTTYRVCTLDHYVTRDRGHEPDSVLGMSAQIVRTAHILPTLEGERRESERQERSEAASRPRRRKLTPAAMAKYEELHKAGKGREAAGIVAKLFDVTPQAVRNAAKKKSAT